MTDIAIRVDNLSKLYHLGAPSGRHQRPDTLRDALTAPFRRKHDRTTARPHASSDDLWALKDVSFEACPPWTQPSAGLRECNRRVIRGEVVG